MMGYAGAAYSPARSFEWWPTLDPRFQLDAADHETLMRRARSLYANCDAIKQAVKTVVALTGVLTPVPCTADEEWNRLIRDDFMEWAMNETLFDASGVLNWSTAQRWLERNAVIDGDAFAVRTAGRTGIPAIAFYRAHQVRGDGDGYTLGVKLANNNRRITYRFEGRGSAVELNARDVLHYRHESDPAAPRAESELAACINNVRDAMEINGYNKAAIKLAASCGWVEEKPAEGSGLRSVVQKAAGGDTAPVTIGGVQAISPAPGHKISLLHDTRPSNEVRTFIKDLVRSLAWSVGLDPEIVFYVMDMNSAGTRLSLAKLAEWRSVRCDDRIPWCRSVYLHYVAYALRMGRVRACRDERWWRVAWINRPDKTIDRGREATAIINLVRENLADPDRWLLGTEGVTQEELAARRIHTYKHIKQMCEEAGVPMEAVYQGVPGGASPVVAVSHISEEQES